MTTDEKSRAALLLGMLSKVQEPPDARDDLVTGTRIVRDLIEDPWLPSDVKTRCREWLRLASEMLGRAG